MWPDSKVVMINEVSKKDIYTFGQSPWMLFIKVFYSKPTPEYILGM